MNDLDLSVGAILESIGAWVDYHCERVTSVRFDECMKVSYDSIDSLLALSALKTICFYGTPVDGKLLRGLACFGILENLNLNSCALTATELLALERFSNLKSLGLMNTAADDTTIEVLSGATGLRELRIDGTNVSPRGLSVLLQSHTLESLTIGGRQISSETMHLIQNRSASLHSFTLIGGDVSDALLDELAILDGLQNVYLHNYNGLTDEGRLRMERVLPNYSKPNVYRLL